MLHIPDDPNDLHFARLRIPVLETHAAADWIAIVKILPRERVVDDGNRRRPAAIRRIERASTAHGDPERAEVIGSDHSVVGFGCIP